MFYLSPAKIIFRFSQFITLALVTDVLTLAGEIDDGIMNGSRFWTQSRTLFILDPLFIIFHEIILSNNLYCADNS